MRTILVIARAGIQLLSSRVFVIGYWLLVGCWLVVCCVPYHCTPVGTRFIKNKINFCGFQVCGVLIKIRFQKKFADIVIVTIFVVIYIYI